MKKIIMISIGIVLMTESLVPMRQFCSRGSSRISALTALSAIRQTHNQKAESSQTWRPDKSSIALKVLVAGMVVEGVAWMESDYRSCMQQREEEQIRENVAEAEERERRAKRFNEELEFRRHIQKQCAEGLPFPLAEGEDEKTVLSLMLIQQLISAYNHTNDEMLLGFLFNFIRIGHCFAHINKGTVTNICAKYGREPIDCDHLKNELKILLERQALQLDSNLKILETKGLDLSGVSDKTKRIVLRIVFARYFVADLWWTLYYGETAYSEEASYSYEQRKEYFKFFELAMQSGLAELIQTRSSSYEQVIEKNFSILEMILYGSFRFSIQHQHWLDASCALYQRNAGLPYFVCKRFGLPMEGYSFDE